MRDTWIHYTSTKLIVNDIIYKQLIQSKWNLIRLEHIVYKIYLINCPISVCMYVQTLGILYYVTTKVQKKKEIQAL